MAVWLSICACILFFVAVICNKGKALSELHYRAPWYPLVPVLGFVLCPVACRGWHSIQRRELRCGAGYRLLRCAMVLISLLNPETQNRSQNMSQNNPLRALLDKQDILLLDGAMATELEARGCNLADSPWSAKVLVETRSLSAKCILIIPGGAQCAITASYQATPAGFAARGLDEAQSKALIGKSVELARKAREAYLAENPQAGTLLVAGSVGPLRARIWRMALNTVAIIIVALRHFRRFIARAWKPCWMPGPICWPAKPCRILPRLRRWLSC